MIPVRQINSLPYVCTIAAYPPSAMTVYSMPLNSSNGRHQALTIGTSDIYKFFPGNYAVGYRWNGTNAVAARIESLVSLHISCDVASCPAFGYQSMGGNLVTRNCSFSNSMVTPYLASSANVIHRTENHALGTSLTTGTTGYEMTLDSNLWYSQHQVRYMAFAFYLVQAYCYGSAPTIYQDCLHWRINNYGYGEHDVPQNAQIYLIEHTSEAGLNTYSYLVKGTPSFLVDPSMPSVYNTLLRLGRANMPKLEITVPDGCYVQVRSFGYRLTPYDSNEGS